MKYKQAQKISLVIPVYNEGDSLAACLTAIENLRVKPYEVIVVDNNSTDHSRLVAQRYSFVKLITEKKQGVVHARTKGFDSARGNIIARIDADTIVHPDWVEQLNAIFADGKVDAVSGRADYYDFLFSDIANPLDRLARKFLARRLRQHMFLHGSNMAFKKSAWKAVKQELCACVGTHEDLDLAIHLGNEGYNVIYDENLIAGISSRRISSGFKTFVEYALASPRTYREHGLSCQKYMYPIIVFCFIVYAPAHLAYQSYDPKLGAFSLRYLLSSKLRNARIDPTINAA